MELAPLKYKKSYKTSYQVWIFPKKKNKLKKIQYNWRHNRRKHKKEWKNQNKQIRIKQAKERETKYLRKKKKLSGSWIHLEKSTNL